MRGQQRVNAQRRKLGHEERAGNQELGWVTEHPEDGKRGVEQVTQRREPAQRNQQKNAAHDAQPFGGAQFSAAIEESEDAEDDRDQAHENRVQERLTAVEQLPGRGALRQRHTPEIGQDHSEQVQGMCGPE